MPNPEQTAIVQQQTEQLHAHHRVRGDDRVASFYPAAMEAEAHRLGIAYTHIDGTQWNHGDCEFAFPLQSIAKVFIYALALEDNGREATLARVGVEPSGDSGRSAPAHPGGVPNCADWVMVEGYSGELSSCGFWPGGGEEGAFYSYAYPAPAGFADYPVRPSGAYYSTELGEFLLPYEAVRTAADPDRALLEFLHTTYEAAAELGSWPRAGLEDDPTRWDHRR